MHLHLGPSGLFHLPALSDFALLAAILVVGYMVITSAFGGDE